MTPGDLAFDDLAFNDLAFDDLDAILALVWRRLEEGVHTRRSAFHTPALATVGLDGAPRLRTVVLREAARADRRLRFHCDRRSDKVGEIVHAPRVALHVYDAPAAIQVRVEGRAVVHADDAAADAAWEGSWPMSRACYAIEPASGAVIPQGDAYALPSTSEAVAGGRANFAAVIVEVEALEVLHLAREGHRRVRFTWRATAWESVWRAP